MIPQTKLETISCRPNPSPTPRAARTTLILARSRWMAASAIKLVRPSTAYRQSVTTANLTPGSSGIRGKIVTANRAFIYRHDSAPSENDDGRFGHVADGDRKQGVGGPERSC